MFYILDKLILNKLMFLIPLKGQCWIEYAITQNKKKPALKKQLWDVTTERHPYSSLSVSPQDCLWYMGFREKIYVGKRPADILSTLCLFNLYHKVAIMTPYSKFSIGAPSLQASIYWISFELWLDLKVLFLKLAWEETYWAEKHVTRHNERRKEIQDGGESC